MHACTVRERGRWCHQVEKLIIVHALGNGQFACQCQTMSEKRKKVRVPNCKSMHSLRIMIAEKKIQALEANLSKRSVEVKFLKQMSQKYPQPSVGREQIYDIISKIKKAGEAWNYEGKVRCPLLMYLCSRLYI